jgi:hypothetical protein
MCWPADGQASRLEDCGLGTAAPAEEQQQPRRSMLEAVLELKPDEGAGVAVVVPVQACP